MSLLPGNNQLAPYMLWNQISTTHSESTLTTGNGGLFSGSNARLWITATASDTLASFSFIVEGGYAQDVPRWGYSKLYNTNSTLVTATIPLYNNSTYFTLATIAGTSITGSTVPSLTNSSASAVNSENALTLTVITNDSPSSGQGRTYNFLFSSYDKNPFRVQKIAGGVFATGQYLTITSFFVTIPNTFFQLGYQAPILRWIENTYSIPASILETSGSQFFGVPGRLWITVTESDSGYSFGFVAEGGYNQEKPVWSFENLVNTHVTDANSVTVNKSGLTLDITITTPTPRVYNFTLSTPCTQQPLGAAPKVSFQPYFIRKTSLNSLGSGSVNVKTFYVTSNYM